MNKIILASQSPRRKQLLEWAEVPFEVVVKETDERFPPGLTPEEVAIYIAKNKAMAVQATRNSNEVIMAADTIVVLEEIAFADTTDVEFHDLSVKEIEFYVDKYKPYDKAGAYAIQEWIGVVGIKTISGDFYNVMGLPVSRVVKELKKME